MKTMLSTLCAAVLCLSPVVAGPASAASVTPSVLTIAGSQGSVMDDLVQVQQRHRYQNNRRGADRWRDSRRGFDNRGRHQPQRPSRHRGSSSSGPDLGSAIVGAIVGGVIVNQLHSGQQRAPVHSGGYLTRNHIDWCHNRWRSYRVSDNSYQPYNGPRRLCVSPYGP